MKKYYFLIVGFLFFGIVNAQIIGFSDIAFKQVLLYADVDNNIAKNSEGDFFKIDANSNGQIEVSEALTVYSLNIQTSEIQNLVGIQYFVNLTHLECVNNSIATLNVTSLTNLQYLDCSTNLISSINVNGLVNLKYFKCDLNFITSLNVSTLVNLEYLNCGSNDFASLNLNGLTSLKEFQCDGTSYELTNLNIQGLVNLEKFVCSGNLINLDLSQLTALKNVVCNFCYLTNLNISGLTNLEYLSCGNNQLSILNLTGLVSLKVLSCDINQLSSLDLSGLLSLERLFCNSNQITSLNLSDNINLDTVECSFNQIQSLTLGNLTKLITLECNYNLLTSLDLSGLIDLRSLDCTNNTLTYLNLNPLSELRRLSCQNNLLTSIDVDMPKKIVSLQCSNNLFQSLTINQQNKDIDWINVSFNSQLATLFVKDGSNESLIIQEVPNLHYICAEESQIESVQSRINFWGYTNCHVNSYCTFNPGGQFNTISGTAKYDNSNNGCDELDAIYNNFKVEIIDQNSYVNTVVSDQTGFYLLPFYSGYYTIVPIIENPTYFSVFPNSLMFNASANVTPMTQNFCITANGIHNDLDVVMLPQIDAIPGFDTNYKILYKNKGTNSQSGTIELTFDDEISDFVSANPAIINQSSNNLSWDFSNLQPFETREIVVTLNLNSPLETPSVNAGYVLNYTATISGATDETPLDNSLTINQTVVNSFDPNDKTCLEGATITPNQVGKEVHYMIRFENTGTANAQNIVVKDMIDTTKFDVNSLIPISGSHPFVTRITDTNKVEFIFENIQLPFDDANNDGYVSFKIKTKPNLVLGNTFSNTASIYFDYNFPIVTNTATTTVSNVLANQDFEFDNFIAITPNPAKEILTINAQNIEISSISIYNTLGQLVQVIPNAKETKTIDVSQLKSGNYFIKVVSDKGMSSSKFIKE